MQKFSRHSFRLKGYDYSSIGFYFITLCTYNRECLFGEIVNRGMRLNESGNIVKDEWLKTKHIRNNVKLDEFIIMPNHLHGIIEINGDVGATRCVAQIDTRATQIDTRATQRVAPTSIVWPRGPAIGSIGAIIGQFKSISTKRINKLRNNHSSIWQRNYYEYIIRTECGLGKIRQYIMDNPLHWDIDKENPDNIKEGRQPCITNAI